jgi:hypothetical protein
MISGADGDDRVDAPLDAEATSAFRIASRNLKTAEAALKAAQLAWAEAVKKLSDEAVK